METMPLLPLDPTDNFDGRKVEQLLALVDAVCCTAGDDYSKLTNCSIATNYNSDILINTIMCCRCDNTFYT